MLKTVQRPGVSVLSMVLCTIKNPSLKSFDKSRA